MKKKPIIDPRGQWAHPGKDTIIPTPTGRITMKGVPYPVYGQDETGFGQMMYPDGKYRFPGKMVYEKPMVKRTGDSTLENIAEVFDPTGITSWDDVYRSYQETGMSPETALEIFGALPMLGKVGKVGKMLGQLGKAVSVTSRQKNNVKALSTLLQATPYIGRGTDVLQTIQQVPTAPVLPFASGGQHGGLDRWFAEKWVDVKTGKDCGRQEGEKRKGYPACRPSRRVSEDTPKTSSELSSAEREKFKRSKTSSERINYQHRRKEDGGETNNSDMANKPNDPALWSRAKSMAKQKFDVYPSAYANGWAAKWYKGKGGTWRKAEYGMQVPVMEEGGKPEWLLEAQLKAQGFSGDVLQQKISSMVYGGMSYPFMQQGGEPDGAMAIGQIDAAMDKLEKLRQFIQPDSDLEPWVSSKLTLMDHYTDAVSDYMMYNPEAQEMAEEMDMMKNGGGVPERYKNMGFTKVGVKKNSTRPGKKWMVLAKKGDQYKVVHGGYDGMKDFSQHGSEQRKENFWNRMGGKNSSKATDPFSPLYWHKKFRTWEEGGEIYEMQDGGTFNQAFAAARKDGKKIFTWNGKSYTTQLAEETNQEKPRSMIQNSSANPPARKAAPVKPVAKRASSLPQDREVVNDPRNIFQKLFNMNEDEIRRFNLPVDVYDAYQKQREDNKGKNFGIVSKKNARAYFFDDDGNLAVQDEVGLGKDRGEDQPVYYKVMTTPSGTYRMERPKFAAPVADKMRKGYAAKNFFYMDNTDASKKLIDAPGSTRGVTPRQAMHGIPTHLLDKRSKAFGNKTVDDNYMSAGCINCKRPFLDNPYFDSFQDGLVYVLPEKKKGGSTFSGNAWYNMGGGMPCYECGGMFAYGGYLPEPVYQQGGPAIGEELDVTPEQLEMLRQQGYKFEII